MSTSADERVAMVRGRAFGVLGPISSCFTLAWLASHRDRLHTLMLGGHRLTVLVIWDSRGTAEVTHDDAEMAAIERLTFGTRTEGSPSPDHVPDPGAAVCSASTRSTSPSSPGDGSCITSP